MSTSTTTPPATEPVVETVETTETTFDIRIDSLIESMSAMAAGIKTWQKEAKEMKKEYIKEKKVLLKNSKKKTPQSAEAKANSSFSKPQVLSAEIKTFLKLDDEAMESRTNVTKLINAYVRDNDLLLASNKRIINVWAKTPAGENLNNLLKPNAGDEITWFNLQKYLARHYVKQTSTETETVAPPAPPKEQVKPVATKAADTTVVKAPSVKRARTARVRAAGKA